MVFLNLLTVLICGSYENPSEGVCKNKSVKYFVENARIHALVQSNPFFTMSTRCAVI